MPTSDSTAAYGYGPSIAVAAAVAGVGLVAMIYSVIRMLMARAATRVAITDAKHKGGDAPGNIASPAHSDVQSEFSRVKAI